LSAARYGVAQAVLAAIAIAHHVTMAEVVRDAYNTRVEPVVVPTVAQSGDDRHTSVDKMVLKEVDVLPKGLVKNVVTLFGPDVAAPRGLRGLGASTQK
jgi:methylaspartate ammonia-lyase